MSKNSLTSQLDQTNRQTTNALALSNAYLEAITSDKTNVKVSLENSDGTTSVINVPSNIFLKNEIERLKSSLINVVGLSNDSTNTIVSLDDTSSFREIFVQNFRKTFERPLATEIQFSTNISSNTNALVENFISPLTCVEILLAHKYLSSNKATVTKFVLDGGDISLFNEGQTYAETKSILVQNNITYKEFSQVLSTENRESRYFSQYNVVSTNVLDDNRISCVLNKLTYSDKLNSVENSRELEINNKLVLTSGNTRYNIDSIDRLNNVVVLTQEAGYSPLITGENVIEFLDIQENELRKLKVPVKLQEKSIIFFSIVDSRTNVESTYSFSKIFDSSNYTVTENNLTVSFDEYFASKAVDIGKYFESILLDNTIPANLGETPEKPVLDSNNFAVVQINKHLTNTPATEKLKKLQQEKTRSESELEILNTSIAKLNAQIAQGNYSSTLQKNKDVSALNKKIEEKLKKSALFASVVNDINTALTTSTGGNSSPKYRARGFWSVQDDIASDVTNPQKIIQYKIRYRYVSNSGKSAQADQLSFTDGDNTVSGLFSPWNTVATEPLKKVKNSSGELVWEENVVENADQQNINQLDIPINFGESVEVQVQAVSEAGYPIAPQTSTWSNLVRIEFPNELLQESDIAAIARTNSEDLLKVKILNEFATQGITEHISTSFREQDRYFSHAATQIASGFKTNEQTTISLFDYLTTLTNQNKLLEEIVNRRYSSVTPTIIDDSGRSYEINNFSTINLFAGYYTNSVDITNEENYGDIVEKVFYLKLSNLNAQTIEMLSISPGPLAEPTTNAKYDTVPVASLSGETSLRQKNGQILYSRNVDINGNFDFYEDVTIPSENAAPDSDINLNALDSEKNVLMFTGSNYGKVALTLDASLDTYVLPTIKHPVYREFVENPSNITPLEEEFTRLSKFNTILKTNNKQEIYKEGSNIEFLSDDKYLVGKNSMGARLFMKLGDIQVNGINTGSSKVIHAGSENSILIPIVYQYRMVDNLGNVDGNTSLNFNSNIEYSKTIGIDMLIAGETYSFDVKVSSKLRPTSVSNNNLNIQSINNNIDSSSSTTPNIQ